jgi:hypothetical protein
MRHPAPWQSWFDLGDWLHHDGPYHGFTQADARAAFEAALDRNPDLLPALEHLFRIGVMTRDSALTASTLARMTMIGADSMRAGELGYDVLLYYRYLDHLARSGGRPHPALADTGAAMLATLRSRTSHVVLSSSLSMLGFGAAQIDFLDRIATHQPASDIVTAHLYGRSVAWAQRGAWDSALVAAGAFAQAADPLTPELLPRQIAAVGRLLGTLDAERISEVMRTGSAMARGAAPAITAEIAWLDGITAYAAGDTEAMHAAIRSLDGLAGYAPASPLRRMLGALAAAARGNTSAAADSLLAIEHEIASGASYRPIGQRHPWFGAVSRLLAARWLLSEGDTAQASRLLTWHEAVLPSDLRRVQDANFALSTFALVEQAAIAEARGDTGSAARFRVRLLDLLDAPVQQLTPLVRATRTSLARDPGGR